PRSTRFPYTTLFRSQETFGANVFEEEARQPRWRLLLNQFRDVMVLVLLAAALMAALLGETADALTIGAIIILNASMGFLYEYRADRKSTRLNSSHVK